ncbi:MAG: HAMP domain-containing sensor histidine kinase [Veillonellales bacterium]
MFQHKDRQHTERYPDQQNREELSDIFRQMHHHRHHHGEFLRHYKYFRYLRPGGILFTLLILYLLFTWVGMKEAAVFFAVLIVAKEILQFFVLLRLEKRIFKPMINLKQGLGEVAQGNYKVKVEYDKPNDLGLLIDAFNEMTAKLAESERIQAEYEGNRKALIANISHDLKTPITAIQGYIEALLEDAVTPAERKSKYLQTIHHNAVYVNKLIDDLFLFSKLDMQKLKFQYRAVPIRAFMDDLMEEYKFDFAERNIQFQYQPQLEQDVRVNLDGKRFHQAVHNIMSNAVQHGPEADLSILVYMYQQNGFVCIALQDNGPGIPEDKIPFIFDRFYRIDSERPKNFSGTGLGLAIARELIEAHGGKITVSSVEGEGSCFTIMLPIWQGREGEVCE